MIEGTSLDKSGPAVPATFATTLLLLVLTCMLIRFIHRTMHISESIDAIRRDERDSP